MEDPDRHALLRRLPAVGSLLASPEIAHLVERYGRTLVTEATRTAIESSRRRIFEGGCTEIVTPSDVERALASMVSSSLRRVINGTGVLLHTNLGRAPLAEAAQLAVLEVARGYASVELDLSTGERGDRHSHVSALVRELLEAEGGLAFNNNAGAVLVTLAALCRGREVIVSRGELVEIGGGFRIPDVMRESGAVLIEVGTTNKVYDRDYEAAISERTAAILKVHRSNFAIVGFTAEPDLPSLARITRAHALPLLVDLGSGLLAEDADLGDAAHEISGEPRPRTALREGADLVAFSGDKLLGGPQAGILAGRRDLLDRIRKHPLARALRADKLTLAALEATLRLYRDGKAAQIPVVRDLSAPVAALDRRAERIRDAIAEHTRLRVEVRPGDAVAGGGSLPLARFPTRLVLLGEPGEPARALARALRDSDPPVITRMVDDRVAIDVRTVLEEEVFLLGDLVERAGVGGNVVLRNTK